MFNLIKYSLIIFVALYSESVYASDPNYYQRQEWWKQNCVKWRKRQISIHELNARIGIPRDSVAWPETICRNLGT